MRKIILLASLFLFSTLTFAQIHRHYWLQSNNNNLHTSYIYAKEGTQINTILYLGFYNNNACSNKVRLSSITFPAVETGFSLIFSQESIKFNPQHPFTCVEEHSQIVGSADKKIISYQLENDGKTFIKANPAEHEIRFN